MPVSASDADWRPPPVRPLGERARDAAIFAGGVGAFFGACAATLQHASAFTGMAVVGGGSAAAAASFVGMRHAIVQGDFRQDNEVVSGLAMGTIALVSRTLARGPRAGAFSGGAWFVGGCSLHHAHRYWLNWRLAKGFY